jgi:hypothetical protein
MSWWGISGILVWLIGIPLVWKELKDHSGLPCQKVVLTLVWPISLLSCFSYSLFKLCKK